MSSSHISLTSLTYGGYLRVIKEHILDIAVVKQRWLKEGAAIDFLTMLESMIWAGGVIYRQINELVDDRSSWLKERRTTFIDDERTLGTQSSFYVWLIGRA